MSLEHRRGFLLLDDGSFQVICFQSNSRRDGFSVVLGPRPPQLFSVL